MDNDSSLKDRTNPVENHGGDVVEKINQKIDDIQTLLNDKQEQDTDKNGEITAWAKEVESVIEMPIHEEEILKRLEEIYRKIQGEAEETTKEGSKEIPIHPKLKQDIVDIIHTSERGIPMFVSNNMKKTAGNLGIEIGEKDKPDDVIEKMKERLKNKTKQEDFSSTPVPEKIQQEEIPILSIQKEIEPEEIQETKQEDNDERVAEIKKQIESLLNPKREEIPVESVKIEEIIQEAPTVAKEIIYTPQKTRTVSDLVLAKLG